MVEAHDAEIVRGLVTRHLELTGSPRAKWILDNWSAMRSRFIKVFPHEFKRVLGVGRNRQAYIPSQRLGVLAAERVPQEQVQNRQVQHG